jgi:hypothetical protein
MRNHYGTFKELADQQLYVSERALTRAEVLNDDGAVLVTQLDYQSQAVYHPNGLVTLFSHFSPAGERVVLSWPDAIHYRVASSPRKRYAVVRGEDGITRYWVLPDDTHSYNRLKKVDWNLRFGLMFAPHPDKSYVPVRPIPDYEISISRPAKREAMKRWDEFREFADTMWDLVPHKPTEAVWRKAVEDSDKYPPDPTDRRSWQPLLQIYKKGKDKAALLLYIEALVMVRDMPYDVRRVPETMMSHTKHWDPVLIKRLGAAGRLDPEELEELTLK